MHRGGGGIQPGWRIRSLSLTGSGNQIFKDDETPSKSLFKRDSPTSFSIYICFSLIEPLPGPKTSDDLQYYRLVIFVKNTLKSVNNWTSRAWYQTQEVKI